MPLSSCGFALPLELDPRLTKTNLNLPLRPRVYPSSAQTQFTPSSHFDSLTLLLPKGPTPSTVDAAAKWEPPIGNKGSYLMLSSPVHQTHDTTQHPE